MSFETSFADWLMTSQKIITAFEGGKRKLKYIEHVKSAYLFGLHTFDKLQKSDADDEQKTEKFLEITENISRVYKYALQIENTPKLDTEEY